MIYPNRVTKYSLIPVNVNHTDTLHCCSITQLDNTDNRQIIKTIIIITTTIIIIIKNNNNNNKIPNQFHIYVITLCYILPKNSSKK